MTRHHLLQFMWLKYQQLLKPSLPTLSKMSASFFGNTSLSVNSGCIIPSSTVQPWPSVGSAWNCRLSYMGLLPDCHMIIHSIEVLYKNTLTWKLFSNSAISKTSLLRAFSSLKYDSKSMQNICIMQQNEKYVCIWTSHFHNLEPAIHCM